ncbi:MAG: hypothetical protein JJ895_14125 [Balneolaceae bacterium]|nr:hypothetical protein [Balneolaceae bacterium]
MSYYKIFALSVIALVILPVKAISQINQWSVYSSFSTINGIAVSDSKEYIATSGGIFIVDSDIIEERFTTVDGLHRLDPMSITYDELHDRIYLGYTDGVIDVIEAQTLEIETFTDINRAEGFTSKQIHSFNLVDGQLFVGTDFGIIVIDSEELLVQTNYLKIGSFERGIPVYDIAINGDTLYAATSAGIGVADLRNNLLDPNSWDNYVLVEEGNTRVDKISSTASLTIAISDNKLYKFKNNSWETITAQGIQTPIDLVSTATSIVVSDNNSISLINNDETSVEIYSNTDLNFRTIELTGDKLYIGTLSNGMLEVDLNDASSINYLPDGPYLNFFSELDFTNGSLLATATDEFPQSDPFNPIRGYYIYKDQRWQNYNRNTHPVLEGFSYSTAFAAHNGNTYYVIGSWGDGIVLHEKENDDIRVFDKSNSDFSGISANREFIVISGIDEDSKGNIWAVSYLSYKPLNVYDTLDDTWYHFESLPINSDELYFRLFIDSNNHLWIPLIDVGNNGQGLLITDPGTDISSADDDTYRKLTTGENNGNLPDDNVTAIAEDNEGEVWIGTTRGIARFIFPDFIVSSNNPSEYRAQWLINSDTSATSRFLLRDVNVASIAVNSANQKWIGSRNQGVWLVNEDGSAILKRFTRENSPLLSNNIQDITIDHSTGEVFFSTDIGLISYTDAAKEAVNEMAKLKVYPNPFVYDKHSQITIENLSDQTKIRILGADGSVFTEFESRGGRTTWDGKSSDGRMLSSGVYFIIAIDDSNNEKGIGKVVIIR